MTAAGHSVPPDAAAGGPPDADVEDLSPAGGALHLRLFAHRPRPPIGLIVGPVMTVTAAGGIGLVVNLGATARVLVAFAVSAVLIFITAVRAYIQLSRERTVWVEAGQLMWRLMGRRRHSVALAEVTAVSDEQVGLPRDRGRVSTGSGPRPFQGGAHHLVVSLRDGTTRRLFDLLDMAPATRAWLIDRVNRGVAAERKSASGREAAPWP